MENSTNGLPKLKNIVAYTGGQQHHVTYSHFPFLPPSPSYSDSSSTLKSKAVSKSTEGSSYHQRCSSESFLIEEQPSWLDDLLNDSADTVFHGGHRRSASDSYAFLGDAAQTLTVTTEESKYDKHDHVGTSSRPRNKMVDKATVEIKKLSLAEKNNQESEEVLSSIGVDQSREEYSSQGSADRPSGSQVKHSASKSESKRAKQHNAHRSRVRKLQYIAHLERTVQILKAESSEASAELEFNEQQIIILTMENRALRQRLESVSQEQIIKQWEQGMLEREIARLQNLYHLQKQQQMQMHQQQQQPHHPRHRQNRSRDFEHQQANVFPVRNEDASSSKGSGSDSTRA